MIVLYGPYEIEQIRLQNQAIASQTVLNFLFLKLVSKILKAECEDLKE